MFRLLAALAVVTFSACTHAPLAFRESSRWNLEMYRLARPPIAGVTAKGQNVYLGGFSSLVYLGESKEGHLRFASIVDRGPNAQKMNLPGRKLGLRPFLLPAFQPRIVFLRANRATKELEIERELPLRSFDGKPITGLPNLIQGEEAPDETPVDATGKEIPSDPLGLDTEGLVPDSEGNWWACEEYRPSILKFSPEGLLLKRYVPKTSYTREQLEAFERAYGKGKVVEALPAILKHRDRNNGFEGIAITGGKIVAAIQSPLDLPGESFRARWIQFDPASETTEAEFEYPLRGNNVDKLGDITATPQGILVIEQNGNWGKNPDDDAVHEIYLVEGFPFSRREGLNPLRKKKVLDLVKAGYDQFGKVEGLALLPGGRLAVINDNDFALRGFVDFTKQSVSIDHSFETVLGILTPGN